MVRIAEQNGEQNGEQNAEQNGEQNIEQTVLYDHRKPAQTSNISCIGTAHTNSQKKATN